MSFKNNFHVPDSTPNEIKGFKLDENKPSYLEIFTLLDLEFLKTCSEVMALGKVKYGFENWKKDLDSDRIKRALLRHLKDYLQGTRFDSETKKTHLAHIFCNLMFLDFYDRRNEK